MPDHVSQSNNGGDQQNDAESIRTRAEICGKIVDDAIAKGFSGEVLLGKLRNAGATSMEAEDYVQQYLDRVAKGHQQSGRGHFQERHREPTVEAFRERRGGADAAAADARREQEEAVENAAWTILGAKLASLERSSESLGVSGTSSRGTLSSSMLGRLLEKPDEDNPSSIPAAVLKGAPHLSSFTTREVHDPHLDEIWRLRKLYCMEKALDPIVDQMQRLQFAQPLPRSIWRKIVLDQYVDFEKLYASMDPGYDHDDDPKDFGGGFALVKKDHIAARCPLRAENEWIRTYDAWEAGTKNLYPHRESELAGYRSMVYDIFRAVPSDPTVAISFDVDARDRYAKLPYRMDDRNELHGPLLGQLFRGGPRGSGSSKRGHPGTSGPSKRAAVPCYNWNLGVCGNPCPNRRRHGSCSECGGDHKAKDIGSCLAELQARRRKGNSGSSTENGREGSGRA